MKAFSSEAHRTLQSRFSETALFCHSREDGNPVFAMASGLPLPACAGTGFAGV